MSHPAPQAAAAADPLLDVLVIGCGLRATGLLTATPELFRHDLGVLDAADRLGVGSFAHYDIESNSHGSDFFGWIDPAGPFGPLLAEEPVRRLRTVPGSFHLALLAEALDRAGRAIGAMLPPDRLVLGDEAVEVALRTGGPVRVRTRAGRTLRAGTVVLATGIRERTGPELRRWQGKLVLSRALVAPGARERCAELGRRPGPLCLAGASHSAFSVLHRILAHRPPDGPEIVLVTRSPVRIHYPDRDAYRAANHTPAEAVPDPDRDICPETGNVHRYSGLRNTSKALFHAVAAGRVPGVRLVVAPDAADRAPYFERARVIVQSTGYGSNPPAVTRDGRPVRCTTAGGLVRTDERGRLLLDGTAAEAVFVMGMDPYPYDDNSVNPTNQYARRGRHILGQLSKRGTYEAAGRWQRC
ncbi:hypothetical protein ADL22_24830 [Streptomyces sp. NRRL F-4489]|uniref:hypothetical protein n=1 Tax=Streptomyces sp. NRRL F-4489 TaxID=1609095 RepID=UPI00074A619D|nr:hypothetical protein [Streptomyces sp. NRRL F-4489]KUL36297.1 hypothetical protein ADL22_24830 [Streptomyces sp. NRRL F-4489]